LERWHAPIGLGLASDLNQAPAAWQSALEIGDQRTANQSHWELRKGGIRIRGPRAGMDVWDNCAGANLDIATS
jgi:hypothetical protein